MGRTLFSKVNILIVKENEPEGSSILRLTFPARSVVLWKSKNLEVRSNGWDGQGRLYFFLFLSSLVPMHTRRDGLDFPVISSVTPNWMLLLRFIWKVWTLNKSLGEILWPSFSLRVSPEDHRSYFTRDFCCCFRSTSSLGYPSSAPGTSGPSSGETWHWASRFIFGYPQNATWKSDENILKK